MLLQVPIHLPEDLREQFQIGERFRKVAVPAVRHENHGIRRVEPHACSQQIVFLPGKGVEMKPDRHPLNGTQIDQVIVVEKSRLVPRGKGDQTVPLRTVHPLRQLAEGFGLSHSGRPEKGNPEICELGQGRPRSQG
jgi:hypothetical protein